MRCITVEVEISRTIHPSDGEYKKAAARIAYALPEDEMVVDADTALREAFDVAQAHVCERLGLKVPAKVILEVEMRIAEPPKDDTKVELTRGQKAAKTRAANKAKAAAPDPDEIPMGGAGAKAEDAALAPAEKPAAVNPAAIVDDDPLGLGLSVDKPTVAVSVDEVVEDALLDVVQLETGDLIKAVSAKVVEMQEAGVENASQKIKKTINSFNPHPDEPFKIPQIPADQRQKFLDTLKLM